jgi:hypothetical protein
MTDFLYRHHESEDEGLYPLVRRRDPAAGPASSRPWTS